jgi:hypothetical protein
MAKKKNNSWDATPVTTDMIWLPGLEPGFYDCPYVGNVIIPTDELPHFSEGKVYQYTTNQLWL